MYKIVWTSRALKHLKDALDFVIIQQKSTSYANKILKEIEITEQLIIMQPFAFVEVENTSKAIHKAVLLNNYSIFYSISDDVISVVCFWDNRQDPKKLEKMIIKS